MSQSTKKYSTFYIQIVTKLLEIWVEDPGSVKNISRIPGPDPQHCFIQYIYQINDLL
jgi:hypothetical protein